MNTRKIAGVGVNLDSLPTREQLVDSAKKTKKFMYNRDAEAEINKEIDESGIYAPVDTSNNKFAEGFDVSKAEVPELQAFGEKMADHGFTFTAEDLKNKTTMRAALKEWLKQEASE